MANYSPRFQTIVWPYMHICIYLYMNIFIHMSICVCALFAHHAFMSLSSQYLEAMALQQRNIPKSFQTNQRPVVISSLHTYLYSYIRATRRATRLIEASYSK